MTDLTDKWKKGELPEGHYYIKTHGETNIDEYVQWYKDNEIPTEKSFVNFNVQQVLAPVPSYEKRQAKLEENTKLKELLKECKQWFDWYHIDTGTGKEYIESWHKKGHEIHQKINQALGEDK